MAITYNIRRLDPLGLSINLEFIHSDEDKPNWYTMASLPENFTEAQVHEVAEDMAENAALFWQNFVAVEPFVLTESSGTIKNIQVEDTPEFNALYERLEEAWTEDETTKYKSYVKVAYTAEEKARNIRHRRDQQLAITDMEAVSDRSPSTEIINYRQALRDITDQETFPNSVVWPIKPIG